MLLKTFPFHAQLACCAHEFSLFIQETREAHEFPCLYNLYKFLKHLGHFVPNTPIWSLDNLVK